MRIVVDFDLCESNAICMGIAPEVFEVRDDDFLYVLDEMPPEELRPKMEEAVRRACRPLSRQLPTQLPTSDEVRFGLCSRNDERLVERTLRHTNDAASSFSGST